MAGHATRRVVIDLLSNELAFRAGLLLTQRDILDVARHLPSDSYRQVLLGNLDDVVGRFTDFYSDIARSLRVAIGNLPDDESPIVRRVRTIRAMVESGHDPSNIIMAFAEVGRARPDRTLGADAIAEVERRTGAPAHAVEAVFLMLADHFEREASLFGPAQQSSWDSAIPLSTLFDSELLPTNPEAYVDQRFLDFLAARSERLDEIHWRNFERLCAEFFRRLGYSVLLGPGVADGGVDVRIFHQDGDATPFLLLQCKRYKKNNTVSIESVKALWTDVAHEKAERGIVITTSEIAPSGKVTATARGYNLAFAENTRVRQWSKSMWTYSYDPPSRSMVPATPME